MPPPVSGTFLEGGNVPLGTLLRGREEAKADPFESLLRDTFSAKAAATREKWSVLLIRLDDVAGEFKRKEASGSLSKEGSDECAAVVSAGWLDGVPDTLIAEKLLENEKPQNIACRERKKKFLIFIFPFPFIYSPITIGEFETLET